MSKKFFMAALAGFLTIGAFALYADEPQTVEALSSKDNMRILAIAKSNSELKLADNLNAAKNATTEQGRKLGYYVVKAGSTEGQFVSLSDAITQEVTTDGQGQDIVALCQAIQDDVLQRFGILLKPEVKIV